VQGDAARDDDVARCKKACGAIVLVVAKQRRAALPSRGAARRRTRRGAVRTAGRVVVAWRRRRGLVVARHGQIALMRWRISVLRIVRLHDLNCRRRVIAHWACRRPAADEADHQQ